MNEEGTSNNVPIIVKEGDTLEKIAIREGVSVGLLRKWNKRQGRNSLLYPGELLVLRSSIYQPNQQIVSNAESEVNNVEKAAGSLSLVDSPDRSYVSPSTIATSTTETEVTKSAALDVVCGCVFEPTLDSEPNEIKEQKDGISKPEKGQISDKLMDSFLSVCDTNDALAHHLLSVQLLSCLIRELPPEVQLQDISLLYSLLNNGDDFSTFYRCVRKASCSLLVAMSETGVLFGGFASRPWRSRKSYYGNGESFVFCYHPFNGEFSVHRWSGTNEYFMWSDDERVGMGGGGEGYAFVFNRDFKTGLCQRSETFRNPVLSGNAHPFPVKNVECWGFFTEIG